MTKKNICRIKASLKIFNVLLENKKPVTHLYPRYSKVISTGEFGGTKHLSGRPKMHAFPSCPKANSGGTRIVRMPPFSTAGKLPPPSNALVQPSKICNSASFLAETSARSAQKYLFSLSKVIFSGSKYPNKYFI